MNFAKESLSVKFVIQKETKGLIYISCDIIYLLSKIELNFYYFFNSMESS